MASIRVGLVGAGFMGRMHGEVYSSIGGVDLAVVCDTDLKAAEKLAAPHDAEACANLSELLSRSDIDVVDVCLPTYLHSWATIEALNAGKHVVCEKPMAMNLGEADAMIAAAKSSGKRLMIAHCIRFWPEYEVLESLVQSQTLGKLLSLNLTRYGSFPTWSADKWLEDEARAGGGALDMHVHDTDYALYLLGAPERQVSFGTIDHHGVSQIFTTMTFGSTVVHLEGGWNLPSGAPFKMMYRAIFERGAAIWDDGPLTIYEDGSEPRVPEIPRMSAAAGGNVSDLGGYYAEMKYFYDQLRADQPLTRLTPESSRLSLATVLEEIHQVKESNK